MPVAALRHEVLLERLDERRQLVRSIREQKAEKPDGLSDGRTSARLFSAIAQNNLHDEHKKNCFQMISNDISSDFMRYHFRENSNENEE